ncbi:MAG: hypothetical protein A3H97_19425 [Acidobacteria bacterium RIFCSPLOWO2_02_FULL_65_29]|nr:MAG: hypothetical protein A3H97_19425 [Acidobacteria bacterium RIFCSPLOWO2_02_FULL_65_29]
MRRGLIGLGHRPSLARWLAGGVPEVECLELTAEHFFDAPDAAISAIGERYPCSVHGLGLSLGTPGPLDSATFTGYSRVARLAQARWATEHVAFTRAGGIDLGHLNPLAPTRDSLQLLTEHALEVHEATGLPVCLENITSQLEIAGTMSEPEFLNALCSAPHVGLLMDVTNLFINAHNHGFDARGWLSELQPGVVRQIHVVGYGEQGGRLVDDHRVAIQTELLDLMAAIAMRHEVEAVILERDLDIPGPVELLGELSRVGRSLGWS